MLNELINKLDESQLFLVNHSESATTLRNALDLSFQLHKINNISPNIKRLDDDSNIDLQIILKLWEYMGLNN